MVNVQKFLTLSSFCSQLKYLFSGLEFTKCFVRIANRKDPDQTASSEAVRFGPVLFVWTFLVATSVQNFRTFTLSISEQLRLRQSDYFTDLKAMQVLCWCYILANMYKSINKYCSAVVLLLKQKENVYCLYRFISYFFCSVSFFG